MATCRGLRDQPRGRDSCVRGAGVTIRPARSDDLAPVVEIERAAGELFRSVGWIWWPTMTP
jgi:hypothetical protein